MAYEVKKTEHSGPKKGKGYWGRKADAKKQSDRIRRENGKSLIEKSVSELESDLEVWSIESNPIEFHLLFMEWFSF